MLTSPRMHGTLWRDAFWYASRLRRLLPRLSLTMLLSGAFCLYFLAHTLYDENGLLSLLNLRQQLHEREAELTQVQMQREALEKKVARLRPGSIDADLVEEEARKQLNFARPNEVMLLQPEETEIHD